MIGRALPIGTVKDYLLCLRISNSAMPLVALCCHTCFSLPQRSMNVDRLIHQSNPWLRKWHWLHLDSSHKQKQSHERSEPLQGRSLTNCLVHLLISPLASPCIAHVNVGHFVPQSRCRRHYGSEALQALSGKETDKEQTVGHLMSFLCWFLSNGNSGALR